MSVYESSITNPKKQLEFYKQLSEQLQQENKKYKEVFDKANKFADDYAKEWVEYDEVLEDMQRLKNILKEVE